MCTTALIRANKNSYAKRKPSASQGKGTGELGVEAGRRPRATSRYHVGKAEDTLPNVLRDLEGEDEICAVQVLACVRDSKPSTKDKAERFRLAELAETTKTDDSSDSYSSDNEDDLRRQRQLKQEDEYRRLQADAQRQQEQRRQRRFQQQQREEQAEQEERRRQQLKRRAQDLSPVSALGRHPKRMTASILARSRGRTYGR